MRLFTALLLGWCFIMNPVAYAQATESSLIETEGTAVVDVQPVYVDFWMHAHKEADTLVKAAESAAQFETNLRKEIETRELNPSDLSFTGVAIPDLSSKIAQVSAHLRFVATGFATSAEGPRLFAELCDKLVQMATAVGGRLEGPTLCVDEVEPTEQAAIVRATEKAYPAAKAAAQVMNGHIVAVSKVSVEDITWNKAPGVSAAQPDLRRLTCTAKVKVTYLFSPTQP